MSKRIIKINHLILKELAFLIQREFPEKFITVISVETTADLKQAKVWVSHYGQKDGQVLDLLQGEAVPFQTALSKKLFIKNFPRLIFVIDKSAEYMEKVDRLLHKATPK